MKNSDEREDLLIDSVSSAVIILIVVAILSGGGYYLYKTLGPAYEETRREIYENSKSFTDGNIRELRQYRADYAAAVQQRQLEQAKLLRGTILQQHGDLSREMLREKDPSLKNFLDHLDEELLKGGAPTFPRDLLGE